MKRLSKISIGLFAFVLSVVSASACIITVRVACPNDATRSGIRVCIENVGCELTDSLGTVNIPVLGFGTYTICVDPTTLPAGTSVQGPLCKNLKVESDAPPTVNFELKGDICETP